MEIEVVVNNKIARLKNPLDFGVCGNSDYTIKFEFDDEWEAYENKTARFKYNGQYTDVIFSGNECPMPVLNDAYNAEIGVYAGNLHTSTPAILPLKKSILSGTGTPVDPTPSVYEQLVLLLNAKANKNQSTENAGKFWKVGEDGSLVFSFGGGGTQDHRELTHRDAPDQHPISAIIDLRDELDSRVKTINGEEPDENGNVDVSGLPEPAEIGYGYALVTVPDHDGDFTETKWSLQEGYGYKNENIKFGWNGDIEGRVLAEAVSNEEQQFTGFAKVHGNISPYEILDGNYTHCYLLDKMGVRGNFASANLAEFAGGGIYKITNVTFQKYGTGAYIHTYPGAVYIVQGDELTGDGWYFPEMGVYLGYNADDYISYFYGGYNLIPMSPALLPMATTENPGISQPDGTTLLMQNHVLKVSDNLVLKAENGQTAYESVQEIEPLIPAQATSQNQLADKSFVNSTVGTNTSNYISNNGQPFNSLAELETYTGIVTNNDYAIVIGTDTAGNTTYTRYKYNATNAAWAKEYVLNNSSFTANQWEAISSGITAALVAAYNAHLADKNNPHEVTAEQVGAVGKYVGAQYAGDFLVVGIDGNITHQTLSVWEGGDY